MTLKFWRAVPIIVLIIVLSGALAVPARAESFQTLGRQIDVGIVVVSVAIGALVVFLIVHYSHKTSKITGCIRSGANGLSVTDEKDKRLYALSGDPVGVKPGDRMTLAGKRKQSGQTFVFEAQSVTQDLGACQP
jgi:hypothetical protein